MCDLQQLPSAEEYPSELATNSNKLHWGRQFPNDSFLQTKYELIILQNLDGFNLNNCRHSYNTLLNNIRDDVILWLSLHRVSPFV